MRSFRPTPWLLALFVLLALGAPAARADQGQMGSGQMQHGQQMHHPMMTYDTSTETHLQGDVTDVLVKKNDHGWKGVHLVLSAEGQLYDVELGPAPFLDQKGFTFKKGDRLEITGSEIHLAENHLILAREVEKDGKTLELRDQSGRPMWPDRWRA